jgi:hypothetical protein
MCSPDTYPFALLLKIIKRLSYNPVYVKNILLLVRGRYVIQGPWRVSAQDARAGRTPTGSRGDGPAAGDRRNHRLGHQAPSGGEALRFENVRGNAFPVVTNMFGSLRRICLKVSL